MGALAPRRWPIPTPGELIRLCPMDGEFADRYRPIPRTTDELRQHARHLAEALEAARDQGWARLFKKALAAGDDQFLVLMGHSVAVLLRYGPVADLDVARGDVEQLLVDVAAMWTPRASQ